MKDSGRNSRVFFFAQIFYRTILQSDNLTFSVKIVFSILKRFQNLLKIIGQKSVRLSDRGQL